MKSFTIVFAAIALIIFFSLSSCDLKEIQQNHEDNQKQYCCEPPQDIDLIAPDKEVDKLPNQYEGAVFIGDIDELINRNIPDSQIISCECNAQIHLILTDDYASIRQQFQGLLNPEICKPNGTCGGDGSGNFSSVSSTHPSFYEQSGSLITQNIIGFYPEVQDGRQEGIKVEPSPVPQKRLKEIRVAILDGGLPTDDNSLLHEFQYPNTECDLDLVNPDPSFRSPYIPMGSNSAIYNHGELVRKLLEISLEEYSILDSVEIVPIRVADERGNFTLFSLLCGLYTAYEENAQFVNLSLSMLTNEDYEINILKHHMNLLSKKGMVFISANGNDESNLDCFGVYPAEYDFVYGISSLQCEDTTNLIAYYSNYSCTRSNYAENGTIPFQGSIGQIFGTSFATPKFTASIIFDHKRRNLINVQNRIPLIIVNDLPKYSIYRKDCGLVDMYYYDIENTCQ